MHGSRVDRHARRAVRQIECLESRRLLSATLINSIPAQNIASGTAPAPISLSTYFNDPTVTGTAVVLQTPLGNIPLVLTDSQTPQTVANFTQYINSGEYANTIFHRSVPGFIIQGGGYDTTGAHIQTSAAIPGEHHESNTTGTIAMALSTGPDSATSEWFINLANNDGTTPGNPNLDDASDGGPFTAFGNVVYNGMSVVNAIANLPIVDDSAQSSAWDTLPVQSGTGGSVVDSEDPSNLVTVNPQILPGGLTYSATSSNPNLVTASVDASGNLTLTPVTGAGTANITVTATDMGGGTATSTFETDVTTASSAVTIGPGAAASCTYTDVNGATNVITLKRGGAATLDFTGTDIFQVSAGKGINVIGSGLGLLKITTSGTTPASVLTIATQGSPRLTVIGSLDTDGLKSFVAKGITLIGDLNCSSSIGTLTLAGAAQGKISADSIGTINIGGSFSDDLDLANTGQSFNVFTAGSIDGGTWAVAGSAQSVVAGAVTSWSPDFSQSLKSLAVKTDFTGSVTAGSVGSMNIGRDVNSSMFNFNAAGPDLGKLMVKGIFSSSTINAMGSIGAVTAAAMMNSEIYAGVGTLGAGAVLPMSAGDFVADASIGSVKLKGQVAGISFSNSDIAAANLGTLTLGKLGTDNEGLPDGIAGEALKTLTASANKKRFKLKGNVTSANIASILAADGVMLGDVVIDLIAPAG